MEAGRAIDSPAEAKDAEREDIGMDEKEKTFEQQVLDRLDKIIELLEKGKQPKKRLVEDADAPAATHGWFAKGDYPKDPYGGDTFYCDAADAPKGAGGSAISNSISGGPVGE